MLLLVPMLALPGALVRAAARGRAAGEAEFSRLPRGAAAIVTPPQPQIMQ